MGFYMDRAGHMTLESWVLFRNAHDHVVNSGLS